MPNPNSWAAFTALAAIRSLKELVGFAVSSFSWTSMPSAAETRGAGTSGVRFGIAVSRCGSSARSLESSCGSASRLPLPFET